MLAFATAGYFLFTFVWFLLPAFLTPVIAELQLSGLEAGALNGAVPAVYIPFGLLGGLVIDRFGWRRSIAVGLGLIGFGQVVRASADGFVGLLGPTLLIGVGGMGITFGLPKLVADLFPERRTGTASSVYLVGSSLGIASSFLAGRSLLEPGLGGWRPVFFWTGLFLLAFAFVWAVLTAGGPKKSSTHRDKTHQEPATGSEDVQIRSIGTDVKAVVAHPDLRLLVVVGTMYLFVMHGLQNWLPTLLEFRGYSPDRSGPIASLFVLSHLTGVVTIPVISDYLGRRKPMVFVSGVGIVVGASGLLPAEVPLWFTAGAIAVCGIGLGGLSPLIRTIPIELDGIGPRLTGMAVGLIYSVGEVGGFVGPLLVGGLYDVTGSFVSGVAILSVGGVVVALVSRRMTSIA